MVSQEFFRNSMLSLFSPSSPPEKDTKQKGMWKEKKKKKKKKSYALTFLIFFVKIY